MLICEAYTHHYAFYYSLFTELYCFFWFIFLDFFSKLRDLHWLPIESRIIFIDAGLCFKSDLPVMSSCLAFSYIKPQLSVRTSFVSSQFLQAILDVLRTPPEDSRLLLPGNGGPDRNLIRSKDFVHLIVSFFRSTGIFFRFNRICSIQLDLDFCLHFDLTQFFVDLIVILSFKHGKYLRRFCSSQISSAQQITNITIT